jgi:NADH-quinone oxidoreductase subunit N
LMAMLAALTMTIGNLTALHQTQMKRFLAYSSIAQAGYLMIGLTHRGDLGLTSVLYYLVVYLVSNMAAFGVVTLIAAATGKEDMRDYAGLSESNPVLAAVMMLAMFSLAGIPPLAGFLGKFYLFAAAADQGRYWLVFVGAVNATISLYYYLVVIKWMYIAKPETPAGPMAKIEISWAGGAVLASTAAAMILIGILPQIIRWTETVAAAGF